MATLTSGQVAKEAGIHVETLRYYERTELLAPPPRSAAGYRQYPPQTEVYEALYPLWPARGPFSEAAAAR
jgi:DNA-binding transcriptional MerR regulator